MRPLYDDGASKAQEATRDYVLKLDARDGAAPLLSVFGGKITTYRRLAEACAGASSSSFFPAMAPPWTAPAALPGGDFGHDEVAARIERARPGLSVSAATTCGGCFTPMARVPLSPRQGAQRAKNSAQNFGAGLTSREVDYLVEKEWAQMPTTSCGGEPNSGLGSCRRNGRDLSSYMARTCRPVARYGSCFSSWANHRSQERILD